MLTKILVPTDGSELSTKAVNAGIELPKACRAKLVALHVYPKFLRAPYGTFDPAREVIERAYEDEGRARADELFAEIRRKTEAAGVEFDSTLIVSNEVRKEVIAVANRKKCHLICMASHGRRGMAAVVLGSETQKVLTHSTLPVLVVR